MNHPLSFKRRFVSLTAGAMLVALLAACGGGGDEDDNDSASDQPAATASSGSSGGSSSPAAGATSSANNITNAGIADLNSYKYSLKMSGSGGIVGDITSGLSELGGSPTSQVVFEVSGSYIKPDKAQTSIKIAGFETSTVVIGNQQWNTFAGLTQGPLPATASDLEDANFLLGFWEGEEITRNIKDFKCGNKENVNGVSATKCTADKAALDKIIKEDPSILQEIEAASLSAGQIDLWLTDAGYPVRMRMDMAGKDTSNQDFSFKVELDVTEINGSFQITPPRT